MMVFGVCPKCGLKLGRKGDFCPRCVERVTGDTAGGRNGWRRRRKGFYLPFLLSVIAAMILSVMIRAQKMGMALW